MLDGRAATLCLVTSNSDFAFLCRKLRERGATVFIGGEANTPDTHRNASDQFFTWQRPDPPSAATTSAGLTGKQFRPQPR